MSGYAFTLCALFIVLSLRPGARGDVIPIEPFQGALSENFDSMRGGTGGMQEISIMDGFATVRNISQQGALKVEFSSNLDDILVVPHSRPLMMGQICISEWEFDEPLSQFGSYFANNSRFDDAQLDFYDEKGELIDSVTATVPNSGDWAWNGWESDVPIKRIVITGNDEGFFNGFIWFDDVQVN